jgi:spore coat polysaccharide biosynthesis predicted glycosyltransferase SpsG
MAEVFKASDVAILPPGQAWAEAAAMQCPTIILGHHQRHFDEGEKIRKKNAGIHLGVGVGMDDVELIKGLSAAMERMISMSVRMGYVAGALKMVNVNGIDKIIHEIKGLVNVT